MMSIYIDSCPASIGIDPFGPAPGCTSLRQGGIVVILHGSLTLDDYVPGRSDVDLLVVIDDPSATPGSPR
jgi:hypothetical protein